MNNRKKQIFFICPVRNITKEQQIKIDNITRNLEAGGAVVYVPYRDTNQNDESGGIKICMDNLKALKNADEVYVFYDKDSQGVHFDLGMAFALNKTIKYANKPKTNMPLSFKEGFEKSFENVLTCWEANQKTIKIELIDKVTGKLVDRTLDFLDAKMCKPNLEYIIAELSYKLDETNG